MMTRREIDNAGIDLSLSIETSVSSFLNAKEVMDEETRAEIVHNAFAYFILRQACETHGNGDLQDRIAALINGISQRAMTLAKVAPVVDAMLLCSGKPR